MTPILFKQRNTVFAENQPEYYPLPACVTDEGVVITCWQFSANELSIVQKTRQVWLKQLTFGQPLQPQSVQVENPFGEQVPEVQMYRHYKGGIYRFVSEATSVDTKLPVIVYCAVASDQMYVRDKVEFHELVDSLVPGQGKVPRFARI